MVTEPKQLLDAYPERLMSATEASKHLDLSRDAFYQLLRSGVIPRRPDGKFDSAAIRGAYFKHLEAMATQRASSSVRKLTRERTRRVRMKADALAMKNEQRRSELVPRDQVVEEYAQALESLRSHLKAIPGRMGPEFATMTPAEAAERVAQLIDDALIAMRAADEVAAKVQADQMGESECSA